MTLTVGLNEGKIEIPFAIQHDLNTFRAWAGDNDLPETARVFYHRGKVWIEMGKEQLFTHVEVKTEITTVLRTLAKSAKLGRVWGDGVLLTNEEAELSGNPDMVFLSVATLASDRVSLTAGADGGHVEVVGTPDMVLEVVSTSSVTKDGNTLLEAYFEAGIPEYWVVDARKEALEFTLYKRGAKKYTATKKQGGWLKSVVFGKSFRLLRETEADGNPTFTLEVK